MHILTLCKSHACVAFFVAERAPEQATLLAYSIAMACDLPHFVLGFFLPPVFRKFATRKNKIRNGIEQELFTRRY